MGLRARIKTAEPKPGRPAESISSLASALIMIPLSVVWMFGVKARGQADPGLTRVHRGERMLA